MIRVQNATRRYGDFVAVDQVSFDIAPGEIVGFLGPNGAGKSTLLKMMSTWLPLSDGRIEIAGFDVTRAPLAVRRSLGYLPEHNALYDSMRVDRFLAFMGRARGLTGAHLAERCAWVVERCALSAVLANRINQCSKGYRQRIGVAAALLHDPSVILLDEPTHGLDPLQVVAFREFVQSLADGRSILFSSHILSEVTSISERLLIIHHGRLLADVRVAELQERADARAVALESIVLDIVREGGGDPLSGAFRHAGAAATTAAAAAAEGEQQ